MTKLFDLQYFDLHDSEVNELYEFVNNERPDDSKINNVVDLAAFLLPNINSATANANKLKSFLFSLNLVVHDLKMVKDLIELHGKYEAFNCYRRVIIKFAIDIVQLANESDYLTYALFSKTPSTSMAYDGVTQSEIVQHLMDQLDTDDSAFTKIFF